MQLSRACRSFFVALTLAVFAACRTSATAPATPIFDGHLDLLIHYLAEDERSWRDISAYDIREITSGQIDLVRLRRGNVRGGLFTVAILDPNNARSSLRESIDLLRRIEDVSGGTLRVADSSAELRRAAEEGYTAAIPAIEGGYQIGDDIAMIEYAYSHGVRSIALTWEQTNLIADSHADEATHDGLSEFGQRVVAEMNRIGMIIDLSHSASSTATDVLDHSSAPVIFSHSNAAARCDTTRNVNDELLRRLASNGGIAMVSFVPYMTDCDYRRWYLEGEAVWDGLVSDLGEGPDAAATMEEWERLNPPPVVNISDVADHVEHFRNIAGIDHVGIGSDFDGMFSHVEGLEDVSKTPALLEELRRRGWTEGELRKLAFDNFLRVMRAVETASVRSGG